MDAVILFPLRSKNSKFVKFANSATRKKIEGKTKVIRSELRNYEKVPKKAEKKRESTQSHTNDCCKF